MTEEENVENVEDSQMAEEDKNQSKSLILEEEEKKTKKKKKKKKKEEEEEEEKKKKYTSKKWECNDQELWRIYMMSFFERQQQLKRDDKHEKRVPTDFSTFSQLKSIEDSLPIKSLPLNTFNLKNKVKLPNKLNLENKVRIWKKMRSEPPMISTSHLQISSRASNNLIEKWPPVWPCIKDNLSEQKKHLERIERRKKRGVMPCHLKPEEPSEDESEDDCADYKELGHARIPPNCPKVTQFQLVDRAAGENPGLVDGDYLLFVSSSKTGEMVYANVCLRGLKGMHLLELSPKRARQKTWKFCFYQAVVALLAKTQLRYKYAWSANIDYIYDHAWMIFLHMGYINLRRNQKLDDIVVYNYKYNIEIELIDELKEIRRITNVTWNFLEKNLKKAEECRRQELMHVQGTIGLEKDQLLQNLPIHKRTKEIEDWFDKLDLQYKNCIFRTPRFSLAFWKDGLFWYLYNPFRCDKFGFWDDSGYACIMKFCSKQSLRRHLMILLLRAYVFEDHFKEIKDQYDDKSSDDEENRARDKVSDDSNEEFKKDLFNIQIFQMIFHCCKIQNTRLLERCAPRAKMQLVLKKSLDPCPRNSLKSIDPCNSVEELNFQQREEIEKPTWLKSISATWRRDSSVEKEGKNDSISSKKLVWHSYYVEEDKRLFSLWGQVSIRDDIFPEENRGKQIEACYVICAGMTQLTAPEYWKSRTLDAILFCGDGYYSSSMLEADAKSRKPKYSNIQSWENYLSEYFKIGELLFQAQIHPLISGKLYIDKSNLYLWRALQEFFLNYRFGILRCESARLGIYKICGAYYMFDVNSMGPPVFPIGSKGSYLLRATYFKKFMEILIVTIGSPECSQFSLSPIEILKIIDLDRVECPEKNDEDCIDVKIKTKCPEDNGNMRDGRMEKSRKSSFFI